MRKLYSYDYSKYQKALQNFSRTVLIFYWVSVYDEKSAASGDLFLKRSVVWPSYAPKLSRPIFIPEKKNEAKVGKCVWVDILIPPKNFHEF